MNKEMSHEVVTGESLIETNSAILKVTDKSKETLNNELSHEVITDESLLKCKPAILKVTDDEIILNLIENIAILEKKVGEINSERNNLYSNISRLERKVISLDKYNNIFSESLTAIEKEISLLAQYGRRESIEILGIPSEVENDFLEENVIRILNNIGLEINSYDIVAVHRLNDTKYRSRNSPPSTIVRFVNRKHAFQALLNKRKLKSCGLNNLFIIENLCPVFKTLFEKCRKLKYENIVKYVWTHNGIINIRYTDNRNEKPLQILHEEDYEFYFCDHDICEWTEDEDVIYN